MSNAREDRGPTGEGDTMGTEEPLPARHRIGRALGRGAANAVLMALACCSLTACTASYVANEAISSNDAVETATNDNIVSNILRARDGVPTFYSDISHFRGSLQEQGSVSAPLGVGRYLNWTGRSLVTPGLAVQSNPSFDVAPLNTDGFTRGINEPIDIRVFQYYLDRAIPPYMLLELFVDKIEDVSFDGRRATMVPYYNTLCDDRSATCRSAAGSTGERSFDAKIASWTTP